jgi:hypothetical protein
VESVHNVTVGDCVGLIRVILRPHRANSFSNCSIVTTAGGSLESMMMAAGKWRDPCGSLEDDHVNEGSTLCMMHIERCSLDPSATAQGSAW